MEFNDAKIKLELLSPAKDLQTGKIAILSGADAVYIGGPGFSARAAAGNPWNDIRELCSFAHLYYAKVYIALNTIFYDGEEKNIQESLDKAYEARADAVIIQDMGILKLKIPQLNIIASTQCHNADSARIKFLKESGFSRVILARELSLEEISRIHSEVPDIELEAFIHGALCVSYSGRCYFSEYLSQRSANRGMCMQPCRLPFDLIDSEFRLLEKNRYLLSTKDLNMSGHLHDLVNAGVTSFKIEGRLKDASYVGNITAKYSMELDALVSGSGGKYSRASSGRPVTGYKPDPDKSFNRGFTQYYYFGRKSSVISETGQKSQGEFIGNVKKIENGYFTIDRSHDLKNGEGICWLSRNGELDGVNINSVEDEKIFTFRKLPQSEGIKIYRNENPSFEKTILSGTERQISAVINININSEKFIIEAEDEDRNRTVLEFIHDGILANDVKNTEENIRKQFLRTGDTMFFLKELNVRSGKEYFVPASKLNNWRRQTFEKLLSERIKNYPRKPVFHNYSPINCPFNKIEAKYNVSNRLAEVFYRESGALEVEKAFELSDRNNIRVLMTSKHCIKYHIGACRKFGGNRVISEPLSIVLNSKKYSLVFDCEKCLMKIINQSV